MTYLGSGLVEIRAEQKELCVSLLEVSPESDRAEDRTVVE
jgi:hypothetical protein